MRYFEDLRVALGSRLHFCSVVAPGGELAAGGLFTDTQGIVQYHLSGTADCFVANAPSKLMLHEVRLWAKREGYSLLHLGGGVGSRADSLFHFKAGFSPLHSDWFTYHLVTDEDKYSCQGRSKTRPRGRRESRPVHRDLGLCFEGFAGAAGV